MHETRERVVVNTLDRVATERFLGSSRDGASNQENETTVEERRKEVRSRRMEQEDAGQLDR